MHGSYKTPINNQKCNKTRETYGSEGPDTSSGCMHIKNVHYKKCMKNLLAPKRMQRRINVVQCHCLKRNCQLVRPRIQQRKDFAGGVVAQICFQKETGPGQDRTMPRTAELHTNITYWEHLLDALGQVCEPSTFLNWHCNFNWKPGTLTPIES